MFDHDGREYYLIFAKSLFVWVEIWLDAKAITLRIHITFTDPLMHCWWRHRPSSQQTLWLVGSVPLSHCSNEKFTQHTQVHLLESVLYLPIFFVSSCVCKLNYHSNSVMYMWLWIIQNYHNIYSNAWRQTERNAAVEVFFPMLWALKITFQSLLWKISSCIFSELAL